MKCQKEKFSIEEKVSYLNGAYMSPLLKEAESAGIAGLQRKCNPQYFNKEDFFDSVVNLKKSYARLLNIDRWDQLAIVPSVSYGLANAAKNINPGRKKTILVVSDQFPSNYYAWEVFAKNHKLKIQVVQAPNGPENRGELWNEKVIEAIDEDTALLAIAHVHWADGTIFDLKRMSQKLKNYGGLLVVDGTQSIGMLTFDNQEVQADVVVAASYKWLLGPYSIGFAYYSDYFNNGHPIENSWLNRLKSDDFSRLVDYQSEYKSGSHRYDMGEAPNFISVPMAQIGVDQLIEWGPQACQNYCTAISEEGANTLLNHGFIVDKPKNRASHLFGIRVPQYFDIEQIKQSLQKENVIVSYRGDAIRVSPSVYNTKEDMDRLVNALISF